MGAFAEAYVAFAQPLIDETDGSLEQMNKALTIGQLCWSLALLSEEDRDKSLSEMQPTLKLDDDELDSFRRDVINPMIRRHRDMIPQMHQGNSFNPFESSRSPQVQTRTESPTERFPGTDRYAPCPCQSGKKYKFCCGAKGR